MTVELPFQHLDLREGMTVKFNQDHPITLMAMFGLMAFASAAFDYRPVVCREFLPNLDVRLNLISPLLNDEQALHQAWDKIQMALLAWLDQKQIEMPTVISQSEFELELFQGCCPHDGVVTFSRNWLSDCKPI
jgi:hypothetical protein